MKIEFYENLVKIELKKHGLNDWDFAWNRAKTINGECFYNRKIIKLSKNYAEKCPFEQIYNTILHEIAHALNYCENESIGHGEDWKKIALSIGCNGEKYAPRKVKVEYKHEYKCINCGHIFNSHRKLKNIDKRYHKKCGFELGRIEKIK